MATPAAKHIRHAVSVHERRLKFKPALFVFDRTRDEHDGEEVDSKEVWFAGNHGDVGGGWAPEEKHSYLLSDTTLSWMIDELKSVKPSKEGGELKLLEKKIEGHREDAKKLWHANESGTLKKPIRSHDMLKYGRGAKWYSKSLTNPDSGQQQLWEVTRRLRIDAASRETVLEIAVIPQNLCHPSPPIPVPISRSHHLAFHETDAKQ